MLNEKTTKITDFYQLQAWKVNHALVLDIYKLISKFPRDEKYGLSDQLKRAAASITANIAEGFGRFHYADKIRFYLQARGSLKEVQNFLILAKDLHFADHEELKNIWEQTKNGERLINGLIRSADKRKTKKITNY